MRQSAPSEQSNDSKQLYPCLTMVYQKILQLHICQIRQKPGQETSSSVPRISRTLVFVSYIEKFLPPPFGNEADEIRSGVSRMAPCQCRLKSGLLGSADVFLDGFQQRPDTVCTPWAQGIEQPPEAMPAMPPEVETTPPARPTSTTAPTQILQRHISFPGFQGNRCGGRISGAGARGEPGRAPNHEPPGRCPTRRRS
ncbi:hypothetical protein CDEF62S_04099 [Castellaniella defragrans]